MNETGVQYAELQEVWGKRIELCTIEEAEKIKALNEKYGIKVASVTTHAFVGIGVGTLEVGDETYNKQMELLKNGIAIAKVVEAEHIRAMPFTKAMVMWGYHGSEQWNAGGNKAWPKFIELYRPIAKLAEEEGISLTVENGFNAMITSGFLSAKFIKDLGSKNVSILWDPANALYHFDAAYPEAYNALRGCIGYVHMKDLIVNPIEGWVDITAIGHGQMAQYFDRIAKALREDGYNGFVSLENIYKPDGGDFVDGYRIDIPNLIKIFGN